MNSIKYHSVNGKIVPVAEAVLNISDIAILRGYGMFDFFLVREGQPLFIKDYLNRFEHSARQLCLELPLSKAALESKIHELILANGLKEASIRLVLTGGCSPDGYAPARPNILIMEHPFPTHPRAAFEKGVKLMLHQYLRPFPIVKTTNYTVGIWLLEKMKKAGAKDILYHDGQIIAETTRANFFIVTPNDTIATAGEGVLKGITRMKVLEIAEPQFKVEKRDLKLEELKTAKEAFITSTTRGVMPVVQIDDLSIGNGKPGEISNRLHHSFKDYVAKHLAQMGSLINQAKGSSENMNSPLNH